MAWTTPTTRSTGDLITAAIWNQDVVGNPIALTPAGIVAIFDGGGGAIADDVQLMIEVPFKCDIDRVTLLADQSGSIVIDIWKDTYANYPPVNADSITASATPTISAATKDQDSTLTGWTTAIAAGDILCFAVEGAATDITRCTAALKVSRS
jgi:hypothetical protein